MLLVQLTGLSGAGKTSVALLTKARLAFAGISVEVIDGDEFRTNYCSDLGFTKRDRLENLSRIAAHASLLRNDFDVIIIAAMNPYKQMRDELEEIYGAKTVFVHCPIEVLIKRDTKGLYARSILPNDDANKVKHLPGVDEPFEAPLHAHLTLNTHVETLDRSSKNLVDFIKANFQPVQRVSAPDHCRA